MKKILLLSFLFSATLLVKAQRDEDAIARRLISNNKAEIGLSENDLKNIVVSNSYFDKTSGTQLVYLQQSYKDLLVHNQLQVLSFKNGNLVSKSGARIQSIEKLVKGISGTPQISAEQAIYTALADRKIDYKRPPIAVASQQNGHKIIFDNMDIARENITAELMWVPLEDGKKVVLAWQVYVIPSTTSDYWMVRVNAIDNKVVGFNNLTVYCNWDDPNNKHEGHQHNVLSKKEKINTPLYSNFFNFFPDAEKSNAGASPTIINDATYRVVPYPYESPKHFVDTTALVTNPWNAASANAASLKWHSNGTTDYIITRGNNVWAKEDRAGTNGASGKADTSQTPTPPLDFNFVPSFTVAPTQRTPVKNQQFNIANLFYWNNIIHDLTYAYGFDEVSGNFQANNQGRGGAGNDFVYADAQDGSGTNNANFSTPADGGSGRMQMFLWSGTPQIDGDVDNGVVSHEFAHGISNRLTGGPAQAGCLSNAEQMGEGWSDYYGLMYTQNWATSTLTTGFNTPRSVGTYVIGQAPSGAGIRTKKYCTNFTVNNTLVYSNTASQMSESHNRGEVWCAALWDMTWNIINQVGYITKNLYNADSTGGNVIALKLVTYGMKLQPCSPGFIDGRDAILKADQILYNGAYSCAIREAFRRRGMGAFASQGSSGSVTDQVPDYTSGFASVNLTQSVTQVPEGQTVTYYNTVTAGQCAGVTNFLLTDTLPSNVTYVSSTNGGTYNTTNRVVSFPVTLNAGQSQVYSFTVSVNAGAYYPTVNLFEDTVSTATVPARWSATNNVAGIPAQWVVSTDKSYSPNKSYFAQYVDTTSDQRLTLVNPIALGATPPFLTFRNWYNTEGTYDGGVLEVSTNGGTTWTDAGTNIVSGGYDATMDATTFLNGRKAWSGSSKGMFIKTKVNLTPYANNNLLFRFRFTSDVGTTVEGWYIDDIAIKNQAMVEIQSNLFNSSTGSVRVSTTDTFTIILPPVTSCINTSFTSQPTNTTACAGSTASFSTAVAGTSPTYQWQVSTNGGTSYTNLTGETNATLTLSNVTTAQNGYLYRVLVSNSCPSNLTSNGATLTVNTPASITTQPSNAIVCAGGNATFTPTVAGSSNTYQWQVSTNGGTSFSDIAGATSSTLTLTGVTAGMNNNQYHLVITSCGPTPVTSSNVTLTVNAAPAISANPSNASVCVGSNNTFSSTATGTGLSYQWQVNTGSGFTNITGANSSSYALSNVTLTQNGYQYQVIVSGTCPSAVTSTPATLTVTGAPGITSQPSNVTNCIGTSTTFSTTASGSGLSYQWQVNTGSGFTNISGAISSSYTFTSAANLNGNQYQVIVTGAGCTTSTTSNSATLTVNTPPSITTQPVGNTLCAGSNITFSSAATGTNVTYQWQVSTNGGASFSDITGATNPTYTVNGITAVQNGNQYRVVVSGTCSPSVTSSTATLNVNTSPAITAQPANAIVCAGSNASFSTTASGAGLTYQWQVSTNGGTSYTNIQGATNSTYTLSPANNSNNLNQYQVVVSGTCPSSVTSTSGVLTVNPLPVVSILAAPTNIVFPGQTITLTANSNPSLSTYAWLLNGVAISNQSGSTINVGSNGLGAYTATVVDANGCRGTSDAIVVRDTILNYTFIYPNPNNGQFHIRYDGIPYHGQPRLITMYDSKGAKVYSKEMYNITAAYQELDVNVPYLSKGTYVLILSDAGGNTLGTGKVVIY